jgi:hypothetical protein
VGNKQMTKKLLDSLTLRVRTTEERLEKVEGKVTALETLYTQHEEFDHAKTETVKKAGYQVSKIL